MYDTNITVIGNLTANPELRTTATGSDVANFRIAATSRRFDQETKQYKDAGEFYISVVCWRELGRHVASSLHRGDPVIVHGRINSREYDSRDEQRKYTFEITAYAVGSNLAWGTTTFSKASRAKRVTSIPVAADGLPEDITDQLLEQAMHDADQAAAAYNSTSAVIGDSQPLPNSGPLVAVS